MTLIENLQARKKTTRHWIHCIGVFVTLGMWLPFYVIILAFRAIHNRDIDSQINGAALAMADMRSAQTAVIVNEALRKAQVQQDFDDNLPLPR